MAYNIHNGVSIPTSGASIAKLKLYKVGKRSGAVVRILPALSNPKITKAVFSGPPIIARPTKCKAGKGVGSAARVSLARVEPTMLFAEYKATGLETKPIMLSDEYLGPVRIKSRFVTQSIARTPGLFVKTADDKGYGSSLQTRVIRKVIAVGRPQYQGAGVWSE